MVNGKNDKGRGRFKLVKPPEQRKVEKKRYTISKSPCSQKRSEMKEAMDTYKGNSEVFIRQVVKQTYKERSKCGVGVLAIELFIRHVLEECYPVIMKGNDPGIMDEFVAAATHAASKGRMTFIEREARERFEDFSPQLNRLYKRCGLGSIELNVHKTVHVYMIEATIEAHETMRDSRLEEAVADLPRIGRDEVKQAMDVFRKNSEASVECAVALIRDGAEDSQGMMYSLAIELYIQDKVHECFAGVSGSIDHDLYSEFVMVASNAGGMAHCTTSAISEFGDLAPGLDGLCRKCGIKVLDLVDLVDQYMQKARELVK